MSNSGNIYFASDFHLGAPNHEASQERERKVVRWLRSIQDDCDELYLLGDLFDFWFEYKQVVPKGFVRLLGTLGEMSDAGIPIHFFGGNHDIWTYGYFEDELGIQVYKKPLVCELQGKKVYMAHGDGLGPGDWNYKFLKKVFNNGFFQWLFARVHPDTGIWAGNYFSGRSRDAHSDGDAQFHDDGEYLTQYCQGLLKKEHFDYFVFGHRHLPLQVDLKDDSTYFNLGDMISYNTFGVMENGEFRLDHFEKDPSDRFLIKSTNRVE